jgi:hypothetical protein
VLGPWAAQQLGDLGADVIKVEPPEGDTTRQLGPMKNPNMGAFYLACNRYKRSIVLDLKQEMARRALLGLLAPRAEWRSTIVPPPAPDDGRADAGARSLRRWPWARLLHRVFAIEVLVCDRCGGPRRILGAVTAPPAVRRVLVALGLAAKPPPGRPVPAA